MGCKDRERRYDSFMILYHLGIHIGDRSPDTSSIRSCILLALCNPINARHILQTNTGFLVTIISRIIFLFAQLPQLCTVRDTKQQQKSNIM